MMDLSRDYKVATHPAYISFSPQKLAAPVVFENPHSSIFFPEDAQLVCNPIHVRKQSDFFLDEITRPLLQRGYPLLEAAVSRGYVDLNRPVNSVHPDHISGPLRQIIPAENDFYAAAGLGLCRTTAYWGSDVRITDEAPTEDEVLRRIDGYWQPYHDELERLIDRNMDDFGQNAHITCHSFSIANIKPEEGLSDHTFFVGTRDNTTAARDVKEAVIGSLEDQGFKVADNRVLKGVELVAQHGKPEAERHSIQVEIVREAYMDKDTCEAHEGIEVIKTAMTNLADDLGAFMKARPQIPLASEKPRA